MKAQRLSPRETTVLHLIAWGYINKEIALRLDPSVKTVEAHKFIGMRKLGVARRAEAVSYGVTSRRAAHRASAVRAFNLQQTQWHGQKGAREKDPHQQDGSEAAAWAADYVAANTT